jgi:hypothetical protein
MRIVLGVPHNGMITWETGQAIWRCSGTHTVQVANVPSSLLAMSFNILYANALNQANRGEIDLFAMLHSDVAPAGFWLDTLVSIIEERQVDLVSVVNAIKDDRRLTSSGLAVPGRPWRPLKRFTMRELEDLPKTFSAEDIGHPDAVLLHNTGCWLADLRKPVFHQVDELGQLRAHFTLNDRIVMRDGCAMVEVEPEDWFFSRRLHELGAKTCVTREVATQHFGLAAYDNQTITGQETDTDVAAQWERFDPGVAHAY